MIDTRRSTRAARGFREFMQFIACCVAAETIGGSLLWLVFR